MLKLFTCQSDEARDCRVDSQLGGKAMMARQAETEPSGRRWPRMRNMPRCSICTDFMVAREASVLKTDGEVSYLWSCDRCGQGFVTEARLPRF